MRSSWRFPYSFEILEFSCTRGGIAGFIEGQVFETREIDRQAVIVFLFEQAVLVAYLVSAGGVGIRRKGERPGTFLSQHDQPDDQESDQQDSDDGTVNDRFFGFFTERRKFCHRAPQNGIIQYMERINVRK